MTINIDGMTIEVKARYDWENRYNKATTMAVLNRVSIVLRQSADSLEKSNVYKELNTRLADEIYDYLDAQGCYDGI